MALSMDEQRILAEIEQQITRDDPSLATRLTTFGLRRRPVGDRDERRRALIRVTALVMIAVFVIGILVAVYAAVLNSSRHRPSQTGRGTTSSASASSEPDVRAPVPQHQPSG
jgi:hypothetical protein